MRTVGLILIILGLGMMALARYKIRQILDEINDLLEEIHHEE